MAVALAARSPRSAVVVAFSTTYQNQSAALQRAIDALGELKVRGLETLGPALEAAVFQAPPNVIVRPSAPHSLVFPQAAAVVTHAGHGTVMRALACGVPLLCMPMGRDQPGNAARVVARGAGLWLAPEAEAPAIRQAIARVLSERQFRVSAQQLGQ